jgi:hypothetical protein
MTALQIIFTGQAPHHLPQHTVTIHRLPDKACEFVASARIKCKGWTKHLILKGKDNKLYSPRFSSAKGYSCCRWDSEGALDYLPALHQLGMLPKGYTIRQARENAKRDTAKQRHTDLVRTLQETCRHLGIKTPRVPAFRFKH